MRFEMHATRPFGLAASATVPAPRGLLWRPAKAAPRNTRSAPLTTNAPHLKAHHALQGHHAA